MTNDDDTKFIPPEGTEVEWDDDDEPDGDESQIECDECGGTGEVVVGEDEDGDDVIDECDECQGAGWI